MSALLRLIRLGGPHRNGLGFAVFMGAAAVGCGVGLFAVSGYLIARAAQHPSITALTVAVVSVRVLAIGRAGFRYAERLSSHNAALRVLADVRRWFYRRLEAVTPTSTLGIRSGDVLARLVSDVDAVQDLFVRGLVPVLAGAIVALGAVTCVAFVSMPIAIALTVGLLGAGALLPALILGLTTVRARRSALARGHLAADTAGVLDGAAELTAFGATGTALTAVEETDAELTRLARRDAATSGVGVGLSTLLSGLTVWVVLLLAVMAVRAHDLGTVTLTVVTLTAMAVFEVTQPLPVAAATLSTARAAADRVFAITDHVDAALEPAQPALPPTGPVAVRLRDVWARYPGTTEWALSGVDLDLEPGRRIALVGANGAGKSTVIGVLLRLLDVTSGVAFLDGVALSEYAAEDVRRVICGVTQDPHIFAATLRDNLRIGRPDATDDELAEAADRARLLGWVRSLPDGWSTNLGSNGARVSGGERQRIALARALLADPPILVLDEPTAHLDAQVRVELTTDLLTLTEGRTTLLATHDLDGLDQVDEIVVLEAGRVAQRGSHRQLVASEGPYQRMCQSAAVATMPTAPAP